MGNTRPGRSAWLRATSLVGLAAVASTLGACAASSTQLRAPDVLVLDGVAAGFRDAFNAAANHQRVVAFLSPT